MAGVFGFYRSAIGKKAVMAVTGILFWGFVLLHMAGNLKLLEGSEHFNAYAEFIREVFGPVIPRSGFLWMQRVVLAVALVFHVHSMLALGRMNRQARPVKYADHRYVQAGIPERWMRVSGWGILIFLVYHILHMTTGTVHPDFIHGDVFHNMVSAFRVWWVFLVYVVAAALVGMHLYHGLWSLFQSLGWSHPRYNPLRRSFAVAFSLSISIGFVLPPFLVLAGVIP
jgi:succinate dehydrogenase / fumarate reductase cytochrome b subunit